LPAVPSQRVAMEPLSRDHLKLGRLFGSPVSPDAWISMRYK
jgi:hypothetical protein